VATALRSHAVVGYHWFEHADEPREGRHDGENSNYGIVTIEDAEYQEFAPSLRNINERAELNHEGSVPTALF
jgi:agarase